MDLYGTELVISVNRLRLISNLPNMMASNVALQGSGMLSVSWLLSVGNRRSGPVGLAKVLVMRLPVKQRSYKY